jgi:hypothetical protein
MDKRDLRQVSTLMTTLFWGSIWGIWEATGGYFIHLTRIPGLPGFVMFPAAFYFMSRAFVRSGKQETIFLTACVAAGFKLLDLFIPGQNIQGVVNPAQAILLESLAVAGFYSFLGYLGSGAPLFNHWKRTSRG